jgi:hypothetical protein
VIGGVAALACGVLALPALRRIDRRPGPAQFPEAIWGTKPAMPPPVAQN